MMILIDSRKLKKWPCDKHFKPKRYFYGNKFFILKFDYEHKA